MLFVNLTSNADKETLRAVIADDRIVNQGVKFDEKTGAPTARIRERGGLLRIRCVLIGGASKDNGYLFGTAFLGTLKQTPSGTRLRGVIITEPLLHLIWALALAYFVYMCFAVGGISLVPIFLSLLVYFMFREEYRKQGILKRYLARAAKRAR